MSRAALAVCGPLALGYALGSQAAGLLGAMGGLLGSVVDRGGPCPARIRRMAAAGICGGAAGLVLGGLVHGRGWLVVAVLIAEQAYQQAELALVQAEGNRLSDTAGLFQALGGGWWNRTEEPHYERSGSTG